MIGELSLAQYRCMMHDGCFHTAKKGVIALSLARIIDIPTEPFVSAGGDYVTLSIHPHYAANNPSNPPFASIPHSASIITTHLKKSQPDPSPTSQPRAAR